jgi:hypothetical protein
MKLTEVVRDFSGIFSNVRNSFAMFQNVESFKHQKNSEFVVLAKVGVKGRTHSISENLPISKEFFFTFVYSETPIFAD